MNIIIVGGGKIGTTILENLVKEGHNVIAVDSDPKVTEMLSNQYDVMCVCGNGVDNETLSEAGVEKAQLLIAVTGSDEFNMLCCFLAKKMGAENTVARIRKPEYNDQSLGFMKHSLDISMVTVPYDRKRAIRDTERAEKNGLVNAAAFKKEIMTGIYSR